MRRQDWTEQLVDKLDSYTEVDLDNLWEGIGKGLDAQPEAKDTAAAFPVVNTPGAGRQIWKRVGFVAASVAAAAAVLFVVVKPHDIPSEGDFGNQVLAASLEDQVLPNESTAELSGDIAPDSKASSVIPSPQSLIEERSSVRNTAHASSDSAESGENSAPKTIPQAGGEDNKSSKNADRTPDTDNPDGRQITMEDFLRTEGYSSMGKEKRTNRLAFYAGSNYATGDLSLVSYDKEDFNAPVFLSNDATPLMKSPALGNTVEELKADKDFDWNVSASIGAWVGWYPYNRVMLSSGLLFTSLDGDYNNGSLPQKAGYIGLPVRIGYALVNKDRLSILASAGARLDCLVKEPDAARLNRWQTSAYVGAQSDVMISSHIGVSASLGTDIYFPSASNGRSPFPKATSVPSVSLGLILAL